ncbi:MAG TPA: MGMT family protein [Candidatus Marinimicrobia bacterium]|nr:MGMT family protein [Candidatus Neomarinimicrobiota bacterium]
MSSELYHNIYAVVKSIPFGKIATYGQIAALAGLPGRARQVGYALHALPDSSDIPWHRVINAKGEISIRSDPLYADIQRHLLESEGVVFNSQNRIPLPDYLWMSRI